MRDKSTSERMRKTVEPRRTAVGLRAAAKAASERMRKTVEPPMRIEWTSQSMRARAGLADKEAVYAIVDDLDVRDLSA